MVWHGIPCESKLRSSFTSPAFLVSGLRHLSIVPIDRPSYSRAAAASIRAVSSSGSPGQAITGAMEGGGPAAIRLVAGAINRASTIGQNRTAEKQSYRGMKTPADFFHRAVYPAKRLVGNDVASRRGGHDVLIGRQLRQQRQQSRQIPFGDAYQVLARLRCLVWRFREWQSVGP